MRKIILNDNKLARKRRRYKILSLAIIFILLGFSGFLVYFSYDYLVFKFLIAENYIYTESLNEIYRDYAGADAERDGYLRDFDDVVIGIVTEKLRERAGDRYTYLYTPPQYQLQKEATKAVALEAEAVEKTPETIYLRIPNISEYTRDFIMDNKEKLNGYTNMVIDLQSNYGGSLEALYDICDLFLDKGSTIGFETARWGFFSKEIKAKGGQYFDFDSIIFLQNGDTASAAEGFINSIRENLDHVTVIGTQSFGKGIGQITIPVKHGYAVKATVILVETPKGNSINKVGITPDIIYDQENIVDFALSQLQN